mgnify:CR=1 FL=1
MTRDEVRYNKKPWLQLSKAYASKHVVMVRNIWDQIFLI